MKLLAATSFALFAIVAATTALAAGQPLITATPVALATLHQSYKISVKGPAALMVVKVKVPPGGSFGWHSHPAAVAVAVTSGTLTLYDSRYPNCGPKRFSRGQGSSSRATTCTSPATKGRSRSRSTPPTSVFRLEESRTFRHRHLRTVRRDGRFLDPARRPSSTMRS